MTFNNALSTHLNFTSFIDLMKSANFCLAFFYGTSFAVIIVDDKSTVCVNLSLAAIIDTETLRTVLQKIVAKNCGSFDDKPLLAADVGTKSEEED